jgi:hypothetical protein
MRRFAFFLLAVLLAGCAGYKLGPTNGIPAGSRSLAVRAFINKTREPRISEYLANSMRKQFQQDGTFRLADPGNADILVRGEVIRFDRTPLSYTTNDVLTPQEYTLTMIAHVVAVNVNGGRKALDRNVLGRTYIRVGNDQSSAEREAIPLLADDLARNTVSLLVDGSW